MADRVAAFTVVLENDCTEEVAEGIAEAIRRLRGVHGVTPHVAPDRLTETVVMGRVNEAWRQELLQLVARRLSR